LDKNKIITKILSVLLKFGKVKEPIVIIGKRGGTPMVELAEKVSFLEEIVQKLGENSFE